MLEAWLAARDADAVRRAWTALAPRKHTMSQPPHRTLTLHGAAQLAGAMLGERADWILGFERREPELTVDRVVGACFLDDAWDIDVRCHETWELHEHRDGTRGVQVIRVGCGTVPGEGQPEGGSQTVVRVFARDRAASVRIGANDVSTIGEVDLAPLDLYRFSQYFTPPATTDEIDMMRGLVAQLASELDAHYDTSPQWPRMHGTAEAEEQTFGDGERSITIAVDRRWERISATVRGLPWGHELSVHRGCIYVQLPDADIDRVLARLTTAATLR